MNTEPVTSLTGKWAPLSNFWIEADGKSVEHRFQAAKTLDEDERARVMAAPTPAAAKRLGRRVTLRPGWDVIKVSVMTSLVREKFRLDPALTELLRSSAPAEIVEGNRWHDNIWGCCGCKRCDPVDALNLLGVILMKVRDR